jgi:hypothetical protein
METKLVHVPLDDQLDLLLELSEAENRTIEALIQEAVRDYLEGRRGL